MDTVEQDSELAQYLPVGTHYQRVEAGSDSLVLTRGALLYINAEGVTAHARSSLRYVGFPPEGGVVVLVDVGGAEPHRMEFDSSDDLRLLLVEALT